MNFNLLKHLIYDPYFCLAIVPQPSVFKRNFSFSINSFINLSFNVKVFHGLNLYILMSFLVLPFSSKYQCAIAFRKYCTSLNAFLTLLYLFAFLKSGIFSYNAIFASNLKGSINSQPRIEAFLLLLGKKYLLIRKPKHISISVVLESIIPLYQFNFSLINFFSDFDNTISK